MPLTILEVSVVGRGVSGEQIANVFHYSALEGSGEQEELDAFAAAFNTTMIPAIASAITVDWTGVLLNVKEVVGAHLGWSSELDISSSTGGLAGPSAPYQTCAVIRLKARGGTRHDRGRKYMSPIPASSVDVNGFYTDDAGTMGDLVTACAAEIPALEVTYLPAIYDRVAKTRVDVVSTSLAPLSGIQRSRRVRFPN